jgi:hypothetical protein
MCGSIPPLPNTSSWRGAYNNNNNNNNNNFTFTFYTMGKRRCNLNIKMDFRETVCEGTERIELVQSWIECLAFANKGFLTGGVTVKFQGIFYTVEHLRIFNQ